MRGALMPPAMSILAVGLCFVVGGCADIVPTDFGRDARIAAGPPDAKKLAELANNIFQQAKLPGKPEMSPLHASHPPQGGDWMFCIKSTEANEKSRYAVFVRD